MVLINTLSLEQMLQRLKSNLKQIQKSWYIAFFQIPYLPELIIKKFGDKIGIEKNKTPLLNQYRKAFQKIFFLSQSEKITAPMLILSSKNDPYLLPPSHVEFEKHAAHFTIRVLEGGHWIQKEKPEYVNQLIDQFLAQLSKGVIQ